MNCALRTTSLATLIAFSLALVPSCGSDPQTASPEPETSHEDVADPAAAEPPTEEPIGEPAEDPAPAVTTEAAATSAPRDFASGGPISDADLGKYYVSMTCALEGDDIGTMTFAMWTEAAPITTRNFLRLCEEGFYDGIAFHRILRDFMVQGGDPTGTGAGNSPHGTIKAEFSKSSDRAHGYGVLSMARLGHDVNTASCQFFLCCSDSRSVKGLDGSYASFGKLTGGVETLEMIANTPVRRGPRGEPSVPTQEVVITTATVIEGTAPSTEMVKRP